MTKNHIMIVEDERITAMEIEAHLEAMDYVVVGKVASGEEAVEKAAELRPDLILMDIMLDGEMNGIEAADIIYKKQGTPIVFLTANSDEDLLQKAKKTAPFGYILKPFEERELRVNIEISLYKHQMERQLKDSRRWLQAILENLGEAVIAVDHSHTVKYINKKACELLGVKENEVLQQQLQTIFKTREDDLVKNQDSNLKSLVLIPEYKPSFPIELIKSSITNEKQEYQGDVIIFNDITKRLADEHDKEEMHNKLFHASKLATIGTLSSGIAHELNNPLSVISGFTDILSNQLQDNEMQFSMCSKISKAVERMTRITKHLLKSSRKDQEEDWKPTCLNNVIDESLIFVQPQLRKENIQLELNLEDNLPSILGDFTQLESVFLNLMTNSRHAYEEVNDEIEKVIALSTCKFEDKGIIVKYQDNAGGMTKETLAHLFDPYYTTKKVGKGTGLGMAILAEAVGSHGGRIEVESELGIGTTFELTFLFEGWVEEKKEPVVAATSNNSITKTKGRRILAVDDDSDFLDLISEALNNDFDLETVDNSKEALQRIRDNEYDLILSDMLMKEASGLEILHQALAHQPQVPVIIVSGLAREDRLIDHAFRSGASGFINKPLNLKQLVNELEENYF